MKDLVLAYPVLLPLAAGCLVYFIPRPARHLAKAIGLAVSAAVFGLAIWIWLEMPSGGMALTWHPDWPVSAWVNTRILAVDNLTMLMLLACGFFATLMALYSWGFLEDEEVPARRYYAYYLWVLAASCGALMARDLFVFLGFWGFAGIPLCLLVSMGKGEEAGKAAKKTLIMLGATDSILILGIAVIYGSTSVSDMGGIHLPTNHMTGLVACLCFLAAALAKAGAFPFHSWVPDASSAGPAPVAAYLPASLDKLLGIYLLVRIFNDIFDVDPALRAFVMLLGVATVLGAVLLALIQHDLRRLLGFHAVSQVGYMVLGIASGTIIGLIGGLFHMLNHTLYKAALFLSAGSAERRTKTGELDKMGGLASQMPGTMFFAVVAALAISGVPPLNGFFSKWLVYQGIIEYRTSAGATVGGGIWDPQVTIWVLLLVGAMFGSALTLASFVKVIFSVFLDKPAGAFTGKKPNPAMTLPGLVLALACLAFGLVAWQVPLKYLVLPAVGLDVDTAKAQVTGEWQPLVAVIMLGVGLLVGLLIFAISRMKVREDEPFYGGEAGEVPATWRFTGVEFYKTVSDHSILRGWYQSAREGIGEAYNVGVGAVCYMGKVLRFMHSGLLSTYLVWCILGLAALLWYVIRLSIGSV